MKKLKPLALTGLILLFCFSCGKDDIDSLQDDNVNFSADFEGITFEDWEDFNKQFNDLNTLQSKDLLLSWAMDQGHYSLLQKSTTNIANEEREDIYQLVSPLMAIMNYDFEFKVGEEIFSFADGSFYSRKEGLEPERTDKLQILDMALDENSNTAREYEIKWSGGTANDIGQDFYRYRFVQCGSGNTYNNRSERKMRFVQKFKVFKNGTKDTGYFTNLYIEMKLYWRNSSDKLQYTTLEDMSYRYNIGGSVSINDVGIQNGYFPIGWNNTEDCIRGGFNDRLLAKVGVLGTNDQRKWTIDLSGGVTHQIMGDRASWYATVDGSQPRFYSGSSGGGSTPTPIGGGGGGRQEQ